MPMYKYYEYYKAEMQTTEDIAQAISRTADELGYMALKRQQQVVISSFVSGNDVFVALPTGFGKSICYACLPGVFRKLSGENEKFKVIVVSPLSALMADQVEIFKKKELLQFVSPAALILKEFLEGTMN